MGTPLRWYDEDQGRPYILRPGQGEACESALGIGAGFYWAVGWHPLLLSYMAALVEQPPHLDDDPDVGEDSWDEERTVLLLGDEPLHIVKVDELEQAMGVEELPAEIRIKLERDRLEHLAGHWGESAVEIRRRAHQFGQGAELGALEHE